MSGPPQVAEAAIEAERYKPAAARYQLPPTDCFAQAKPHAICLAQTPDAELANSITHGLGLVLSLTAAAVLIPSAWRGDMWQFVACAIYAATMIAVYAASTASHLVQRPRP